MPSAVDEEYLSQALSMKANSARANVLPPLRLLGIIDAENKPTPLANRWREDDEYPIVCKEMLDTAYPPTLRDVFPGPEVDRSALEAWFRRTANVGDAAAGKMASTYLLLVKSDPSEGNAVGTSPVSGAKKGTKPKAKSATAPVKPSSGTKVEESSGNSHESESSDSTALKQDSSRAGGRPTLHIDVQVHISPDSTPEQIDVIFASMAKHLYGQ
jgi:hypothetical protein